MEEQTTFRFGELEAILADVNDIESVQRTSFAARLKDIQRQGLLRMEDQRPGKAAAYGLRELLLMAVAVEMCQLGLSAKRAVEVMLEDEFPLWMCVMGGAQAIERRPEVFNPGPGDTGNPPERPMWGFSPDWHDSKDTDPLSMFLYFDPSVLAPWVEYDGGELDRASATFFYAGSGIVAESISRWTTGPTRRLALINVTKLVFDIAAYLRGTDGLGLCKEIAAVAEGIVHRGDFDIDGWLANVAKMEGMMVAADPKMADPWLPLSDFIARHTDRFGRYLLPVEQEIDEADRLRLPTRELPDMVMRLPGQRELMVDAKVSPLADIPQLGIYSRLEELAEKPYRHQFADRTEYIVLYIPSDYFFAGAISADNSLIDMALHQKVIIATPSIMEKLLAQVEVAWAKYREDFPDLWQEEYESLAEDPRRAGYAKFYLETPK
jgi:hypothetical protein